MSSIQRYVLIPNPALGLLCQVFFSICAPFLGLCMYIVGLTTHFPPPPLSHIPGRYEHKWDHVVVTPLCIGCIDIVLLYVNGYLLHRQTNRSTSRYPAGTVCLRMRRYIEGLSPRIRITSPCNHQIPNPRGKPDVRPTSPEKVDEDPRGQEGDDDDDGERTTDVEHQLDGA